MINLILTIYFVPAILVLVWCSFKGSKDAMDKALMWPVYLYNKYKDYKKS